MKKEELCSHIKKAIKKINSDEVLDETETTNS